MDILIDISFETELDRYRKWDRKTDIWTARQKVIKVHRKDKQTDCQIDRNIDRLLKVRFSIMPIKNDQYRSIQILNYQWQASIHFNWPMVVQYGAIFLKAL